MSKSANEQKAVEHAARLLASEPVRFATTPPIEIFSSGVFIFWFVWYDYGNGENEEDGGG